MFYPVPILAAREETAAMHLFQLGLPAEVAAGYTTPGQFVKARAGAAEGFFALASAPDHGHAEILVKRGGAVADALCELGSGDEIEVSAPIGKGFPVSEARGRGVILCGAGSGIAPLRAVVQHVVARRDEFGPVTLFHGQRASEDFAFAREHEAWASARISVVTVCSRPLDGYAGLTGYVQDALAHVRPDTRDAVAFLTGMKGMILAVTEQLVGLGMPRERIYLNH
jgi:NAD(P)H-flavin reductase